MDILLDNEWIKLVAMVLLGFAGCFAGYRLQKLWIAIAAYLLGYGIVVRIVTNFTPNRGTAVGCAIVFGLIIAGLSFNLYQAGIVIAVCVAVTTIAVEWIPNQWVALTAGILVGFFLGVLAVRLNRPVVILLTGILGGFVAGRTLFLLLQELGVVGSELGRMPLLLGAALAAAGVLVQWKTKVKAV